MMDFTIYTTLILIIITLFITVLTSNVKHKFIHELCMGINVGLLITLLISVFMGRPIEQSWKDNLNDYIITIVNDSNSCYYYNKKGVSIADSITAEVLFLYGNEVDSVKVK